jgi:hypothetical protein
MDPTRRAFALALLQAAAGAGARAQDEPLGADLVRTGLYVITGAGGHTLLRFTATGIVLVNGKRAGAYRRLMSQVRRINRIGDLPVRLLVLTDHADDHAGNQPQFAAAGVPVVAHENARQRLSAHPGPGSPTAPIIPYADDYDVHMGGAQVRLMHYGPARTDGDTVVHFPDLKVVALGGLYTRETASPDAAAGGSLAGWAHVLGRVLQLDFDVAVADSGPAASRADVEALRRRIQQMAARDAPAR